MRPESAAEKHVTEKCLKKNHVIFETIMETWFLVKNFKLKVRRIFGQNGRSGLFALLVVNTGCDNENETVNTV